MKMLRSSKVSTLLSWYIYFLPFLEKVYICATINLEKVKYLRFNNRESVQLELL